MNQRIKSVALIALPLLTLFVLLIPRLIQEARHGQILDATVKMMMFTPQPADEGDAHIVSKGLGTLIHQGGEAFIVTHDHWSLLDQSLEGVRFSDADDNVLLTISGSEFEALILYRDGGTMIIRPPEDVLRVFEPTTFIDRLLAASPGETSEVQPGDSVVLTKHEPNSGGIILVEANVKLIGEKQGRPILRLQNQDGEQVIPGDSGGGVWYRGQLIGNLWTTIMLEQVANGDDGSERTRRPTTFSLAAMFPAIS